MKTHTPGPWRICEPYTDRNVFPIGYDRADGATAILGEANGQGGMEHENMANAKLIAAAPELLKACKFVLSQLAPEDAAPGTQCILYSDCLSPKETDDETVVDMLRKVIGGAS